MKPEAAIPDQNFQINTLFFNRLLAEEYVLYTKTRITHWNVDGSNYFETHLILENQLNAIDAIIDDLAEHIRSKGNFVLGTLGEFSCITQSSVVNFDFPISKDIIQTLVADHETIISIIRSTINSTACKYNDHDTINFLTGIIEQHEKIARRLRTLLAESDSGETTQIRSVTNQHADNIF
jgi:starvation-inducible DNA-binding protein